MIMSTSFKRAYKACDRCRKNKSKCEVDPGGSACIRCVREQKQCVFPAQRSTKRVKRSDRQDQNAQESNATVNDSGGVHALDQPREPTVQVHAAETLASTWQTSQNPEQSDLRSQGYQNQSPHVSVPSLENQVLTTFVTTSRDAIDLLFRAAEQQDSDSSEPRPASEGGVHDDAIGSIGMPSPGLASSETVSLWSQHRFVRQGWFTPLEAISYVT